MKTLHTRSIAIPLHPIKSDDARKKQILLFLFILLSLLTFAGRINSTNQIKHAATGPLPRITRNFTAGVNHTDLNILLKQLLYTDQDDNFFV